jgi:hypothetical protein
MSDEIWMIEPGLPAWTNLRATAWATKNTACKLSDNTSTRSGTKPATDHAERKEPFAALKTRAC